MERYAWQRDHPTMGLFRRKHSNDDAVEERCPQCNEPLPEGAVECVMCGADLRPLSPAEPGQQR
jgi:hypothetical protein